MEKKELDKVINYVKEIGGIDYTKNQIKNFYESALNDLNNFKDNEYKESLKKLIEYVIKEIIDSNDNFSYFNSKKIDFQRDHCKVFEQSRVEEVVGEFVQLKKSGSNFKGLSPFSNEKTQVLSFLLNKYGKILVVVRVGMLSPF